MTEPSESPYLPNGLQWAWDSTSIGLAKDCWRKYYYAQILGYRSKADNVHLTFGLHYAKALERYHTHMAMGHGYDTARDETIKDLLKDSFGWQPDHNFKTRDTLIRSVVWYLEEFKNDPCQTVTLENGEAAVELSFRFQVSDDLWLCGHLDRLVEYVGQYYVQDQKTTGATLSPYYFKRFNPDNQMSLYSLAAKVVFATQVAGVMIDAAQVAVGFTRFERGFTHRTELQLDQWLSDTIYRLSDAERARDAGWPMNDAACQKYGGCPFIDVCSKDPRVANDFLSGNFEIRPWNPLEVR